MQVNLPRVIQLTPSIRSVCCCFSLPSVFFFLHYFCTKWWPFGCCDATQTQCGVWTMLHKTCSLKCKADLYKVTAGRRALDGLEGQSIHRLCSITITCLYPCCKPLILLSTEICFFLEQRQGKTTRPNGRYIISPTVKVAHWVYSVIKVS